MSPDFAEIASHFRFHGDLTCVEPVDSGHINDSYVASFHALGRETHRYLLQLGSMGEHPGDKGQPRQISRLKSRPDQFLGGYGSIHQSFL